MKLYSIVLTVFLIFGAYPGRTQCCSGGVPVSGTIGASTSDKGQTKLSLIYDLNVLNDLFEQRVNLNDKSRERRTHSILTEINYGFTDRISFTGLLSFVRQERRIQAISGFDNNTFTRGVGDAMLLFKYRIIRASLTKNVQWSIGLGPKIPLGSSTKVDNQGISLPADLQPGSGAWDALFWTVFDRYHLFVKNLTFTSMITYRLTGVNQTYLGDERYRFGNELAVNIFPTYRLNTNWMMFDFGLGVRYRNQIEDQFNDQYFPNSGGDFISVIPNFALNPSPNLAFKISANLPVYRNVSGTQLTTSYKFSAALSWKFKKRTQKKSSYEKK